MTAVRGSAVKERSALERIRERAPGPRVIAIAALSLAITVTVIATGLFGAFGGKDEPPPPPAHIADTRSSWIPGQASLATAAGYEEIAGRAEQLAGIRSEERADLLKRIADRKKADLKRERDRARERYLALRRAALARYRALVRANAKKSAAAAKKRRIALAEYREKLRKYRESLIIKPGEECKLASVRQRYDCSSGTIPHEPIPGLE